MEHDDTLLGAAAGQVAGGALVFTAGVGGGKSRLANEIVARAQLAHVPCGRGRFLERAQAPYAAIAQALRGLLPAIRLHAADALAAAAPALGALLPELAGSEAQSVPDPLRLREVLADLVAGLAEKKGAALIFEDLHLADPPSAAVLAALAERAAGVPLALMATARPTREGVPALAGVLIRALAPLDAAGTREMAAAMLGADQIGDALAAQLHAASAGVPARVARLLAQLTRDGVLLLGPQGWRTDVAVPAEALPPDDGDRLARTLAELPTDARAVATAMAVLDGGPAERIGAVAGLSDDALLDALDALERAGVVRREPGGEYGFVERDAGDAASMSTSAELRRELHARAATAISAEHPGSGPDALPTDALLAVANHLLTARREAIDASPLDEAAAHHALAAGRRSLALHDVAEAEALLASGLAASERARAEARVALQPPLLEALGAALSAAGRFGEAVAPLQTAIGLVEAAGDRPATARLRAAHVLALVTADRLAEAATEGALALRACLAVDAVELAAACMQAASRARLALGEPAEAIGLARGALSLCENRGLPSGRPMVGLGLALTAAGPAGWAEAIARLEDGTALLDRAGDGLALAEAHGALADVQAAAGETGEALRAATRQLRTALAVGAAEPYGAALVRLAAASAAGGSVLQAQRLARDAGRAAGQHGLRGVAGPARLEAARARVLLGDFAGALALLAETDESGDAGLVGRQLLVRAEIWLAIGHAPRAAEAAAALLAPAGAGGLASASWRAMAVGIAADLQLGAVPVEERLARLADEAEEAGSAGLDAVVARLRAMCAIREERWEAARPLADRAAKRARTAGDLLAAAEAEGLRGEVALALGVDAAPAFQAMADLARRLDAPIMAAQAAFGLAAARPYGDDASLAAAARATVAAAVAAAPFADRGWLSAAPAIARVLAGNHIGYSLPRVVRPGTGPLQAGWLGRIDGLRPPTA